MVEYQIVLRLGSIWRGTNVLVSLERAMYKEPEKCHKQSGDLGFRNL